MKRHLEVAQLYLIANYLVCSFFFPQPQIHIRGLICGGYVDFYRTQGSFVGVGEYMRDLPNHCESKDGNVRLRSEF